MKLYIKQKVFSWGDTYEVDIVNNADIVMALCVVLVIDAVISQQNSRAAATTG